MTTTITEATIAARRARDDDPVYSERYVTSLHERMREERERHEAERRELRDGLATARAMIAEARRELAGVTRALERVPLAEWCETKDRPKEGS